MAKDIIARALALSRSGGGGGGGGGREVVSITFLSSDKGQTSGLPGATDTYKILYSDGTYDTFRVYNGENGETPLLRKNDSLVEVSYDNGETWSFLFSLDGISGVSKYSTDATYTSGQIVYLTQGQIYQATKNFDASTDYPTDAENFDADIKNGNLTPIIKPIPKSYIDSLFT